MNKQETYENSQSVGFEPTCAQAPDAYTLELQDASSAMSRDAQTPVVDQDAVVRDTMDDEDGVPTPGSIVDQRYRVIRELGSGSFGWVLLVEHTFLGQRFAMKILRHSIANDPAWAAAFYEEARATSMIGHENIVFMTDFGCCQKHGYYFVMEHLEGVPLSVIMEQEQELSLRRILHIILEIANGLAAAHDLGIVHCDLKPANVMILPRPDKMCVCKILDFGISNHVAWDVAHEDYIFGTPMYMAPEQTESMHVDARADQFSLATMMYRMCTGEPPWSITSMLMATSAYRTEHPVQPPSRLNPKVTRAMDDVLLRALDVDPKKRWPDIQTFAYALSMASGVRSVPRADPGDLGVVHDHVWDKAPSVVVKEPTAGESMMVVVDECETFEFTMSSEVTDTDEEGLVWMGPIIDIRFCTAARLRREWRRNLVSGSLFVPTECMLPAHTIVCVALTLTMQEEHQVLLMGEVLPACSASPFEHHVRGFGVGFKADEVRKMHAFVHELDLGLRHHHEDLVRVLRAPTKGDNLSMGEAYVLSRLGTMSCAVSHLRSMCSGLPFELDVCLWSLIDKGHIMVLPFEVDASSEHESDRKLVRDLNVSHLLESAGVCMDKSTRDELLKMVVFFKANKNYMSAMETLYRAIDVYPKEVELYQELAMLYAEFKNDLSRAHQMLFCGLQLEPNNTRLLMTQEYLQTLST